MIRAMASLYRRAYYDAATISRLQPPPRRQPSPNVPALSDWPTIAARVRALNRNNPIFHGAIKSLVNTVWPTPLKVEPLVAFPGTRANTVDVMNDSLERLWNRWCAGPLDFDGWESHRESWETLLRKLTRVLVTDGEVFVIFRNRASAPGLPSLQIELAERDRLGEAINMGAITARRAGIEYDEQGRPAVYTFRKSLDVYTPNANTVERIPARDVLHIMRPDRPQQEIGEIGLGPVMTALSDLSEYIGNELETKALMSRVAGIVHGDMSAYASDMTDGAGNPFRQMDVDSATIWEMPKDYEWKELNLDRPGSNFDSFVSTCLRFVAVGLGLPYSLVSADFRAASYSSERMAWLHCYPNIVDWRHLIRDQGARRIYERFVQYAFEEGLIRTIPGYDPATLFDAAYRLPGFRYIDPQKDIAAEVAALSAGLKSPQQITAAHGDDYYEIIDQIAEAQDYARRKGVVFPSIEMTMDTSEEGTPARPAAPTEQDPINRTAGFRMRIYNANGVTAP